MVCGPEKPSETVCGPEKASQLPAPSPQLPETRPTPNPRQ
jgi:hypothetical protein